VAPSPKPPSQRRRRNAAPPTTKIDATAKIAAPPIPPGLDERATEIWAELWAEPIAVIWESCDHGAVARLCRYRSLDERDATSSTQISQLTILEDRLGLSPQARRRLQYEFDKAAGATASAPAAPIHDDRFLRVVS
jgi:hypothetical protein